MLLPKANFPSDLFLYCAFLSLFMRISLSKASMFRHCYCHNIVSGFERIDPDVIKQTTTSKI